MRVINRDPRTGNIKLKVQTLDDLWHLYNVIEGGDLVFALTTRREETRADAIRAERGEKKRMWLGIRVEKTEFHEFSDWLRIHGVIEEGRQDIGSYHTLNISLDDELSIQKIWLPHQLDILVDAEKTTARGLITLLSIDDDEAVVAQLREYGVKQTATIRSPRSGKLYKTKDDREQGYFDEVITALKTEMGDGPLIVLGPGFAKERVVAYGRDKAADIFKDCHLEASGQSGMAGVTEVLKKGVGSKVLEDSRVAMETQLVEGLLAEISKEGLYAYGETETRQAVEAGAVETLLVTSNRIRTKTYEEILAAAQNQGSKVVIISEVHEAGKTLEALGGVGALLRYKMG
ncbi:MAG: hypothetical protein AYK23_04930 [Candidatus Proteinoplasmatales archaeon SG8-5]|nr:MAG: hypothetical protein AYK23_04930 [Candidatus Proteinoplasmatales archaeon SG8-5]